MRSGRVQKGHRYAVRGWRSELGHHTSVVTDDWRCDVVEYKKGIAMLRGWRGIWTERKTIDLEAFKNGFARKQRRRLREGLQDFVQILGLDDRGGLRNDVV